VGLHSQVQAAQKAAEGKYTAARVIQKRNMRMVRRALDTEDATESQQQQYELWNEEAVRLNDAIKKTKVAEKKQGIRYHSADEDEGSGSEDEKEKVQVEKQDKKEQRR